MGDFCNVFLHFVESSDQPVGQYYLGRTFEDLLLWVILPIKKDRVKNKQRTVKNWIASYKLCCAT